MKIKLKTSVNFCSNGWLVEWGFYALSASKAILRARTYNCNLCDFYQHIRDVYYQGFREHCNNFDVMNHTEKLNYLMSADVVKTTVEFIYKCYCKRRDFIYK